MPPHLNRHVLTQTVNPPPKHAATQRNTPHRFFASANTLPPPQRNYRTFLLFIYGSTAYIVWTFAISLWSFWVKARELQAAAGGRPPDILQVLGAWLLLHS